MPAQFEIEVQDLNATDLVLDDGNRITVKPWDLLINTIENKVNDSYINYITLELQRLKEYCENQLDENT